MEVITIEQVNKIVDTFKERTKKECYTFEISEEKASITDTKLAGVPYLPEGEELPKDEAGDDMVLFAQINFEDIKLENYPEKGILQIFIGKQTFWPTPYKVKYYEDISLPSRTDIKFNPTEDDFISEEIKLSLKKSITFMPINDYRFFDTFEEVAEEVLGEPTDFDEVSELAEGVDLWDEFCADNGNIGGYADFTQNDPRDGDLDEDFTECIIKVDSNLDFRKIMIGDSGIAWLLITKEDLINKNFENASFDWDCC